MDPSRASVYLDASTGVLEPDPRDVAIETVEFVLHADDRAFGFDPRAWRLLRRTPADWERVVEGDGSGSRRTLERGRTHTWSLSLRTHPTPRTDRTTYLAEPLGDGRYAFGITGRIGGPGGASRVACVALFEVRREQVTVTVDATPSGGR